MEEITEEQRQRAERNRLAALAKRKAAEAMKEQGVMGFYKSRKISPEPPELPLKFRARLEICSPDSFLIKPSPLPPFPYPGEEECLKKIGSWLNFADPSHYTQNHGGEMSSVYKLEHYDMVIKCFKKVGGVEIQEIPWRTLNVVQKFSHSLCGGRWMPCMPEHLDDESVDALLKKLPKVLVDALLPFQLDGVRFGLRRGGCCLIADEMGLGKTLQAITIGCCFMDEGPILIVCPAILRFSWAEELERWLPILSPTDIHLVFGQQDNPSSLTRCPKVVVISYTMLHHLRKSILAQEWALLIVDESHHLRCSKRAADPQEVKAVLDLAANVKRKVLLSGTPSLSRPYDIFHQINMLWPGLLGSTKYDFAKTYCEARSVQTPQGKIFQDFSRGVRLEELNVLLTQTVMIRRLKEHLLVQLPPKRRQIIRLLLTRSDINMAISAMKTSNGSSMEVRQETEPTVNLGSNNDDDDIEISESLSDSEDNSSTRTSRQLSYQELGYAKLSGFEKWLSIHPIVTESELEGGPGIDLISHKMIIFAHHIKVLDRVQSFICERNIKFVRIDGSTLAQDRQSAVQEFRSSPEVKIAIIGITAGGVGVDFSSAQNVVFLELPKSISELLQAEDRAHRRGQTNAVNIYIFCAKDTSDELRWLSLNRSLQRVSSVMNGKYDAVREISIGGVSDLVYEGECNTSEKSEDIHDVGIKDVASGGNTDIGMDSTVGKNSMHKKSDGENSETEGEVSETDSEDLEIDGEDSEIDMFNDNIKFGGLKRCTSKSWSIRSHKDLCVNKLTKTDAICLEPDRDDKGAVVSSEADLNCPVPPDSLRFEVSQYTGRIHLYACILAEDSTPRLLFENFRPEELESLNLSTDEKSKSNLIKENPAYKDVITAFLSEWNNLRPIEQKKLFGKPIRCPLSLELSLLQESNYHGTGGLLKGGSKRRVTPLSEISNPLPENAVWKKVSLCRSYGKKEKNYMQGWTITGDPLCKLCQMPCKGKFARTPEIVDHLFCQVSCMEGFRARTNQKFLREELFKIEHGVCRVCNLDCHKLVKCIRPLSVARRKAYILKSAPKMASHKKLLEKLVNEPREGNAWHADHIVAVHKGGGECMLENMRTLCVACHKEVTANQAKDRRLARIDANKRLKKMLRSLKNQTEAPINCNKQAEEDELLVMVPGSAYTEVTSLAE
ncbi:DNA helicase [Ranunculus cassubicifolius]